jgi:hypothetical protein
MMIDVGEGPIEPVGVGFEPEHMFLVPFSGLEQPIGLFPRRGLHEAFLRLVVQVQHQDAVARRLEQVIEAIEMVVAQGVVFEGLAVGKQGSGCAVKGRLPVLRLRSMNGPKTALASTLYESVLLSFS